MFQLTGPDGIYDSAEPGTLGGYSRSEIYGRLDCASALRALARGGYAQHRVFFADEATALEVGYRPCAVCLPAAYAAWRGEKDRGPGADRGGFGPQPPSS